MRYLSLVLLLTACRPTEADRIEQLSKCKASYRLADSVQSCLIQKYDWEPGAAQHAVAYMRAAER